MTELVINVIGGAGVGKTTVLNAIMGGLCLPYSLSSERFVRTYVHNVLTDEDPTFVCFDAQGCRLSEHSWISPSSFDIVSADPRVVLINAYQQSPDPVINKFPFVVTESNALGELVEDGFPNVINVCVLADPIMYGSYFDRMLRSIADIGHGHGDVLNRFVFILNKADEYDPDKGERLSKKIKDVMHSIECFGIERSRIFPLDARMANVLQRSIYGQPLDEDEEDCILPLHASIVKREWRHFSDFSPLSCAYEKKHLEKIEEAKFLAASTGDYRSLALLYTGIVAIKLEIAERCNNI